MPAAYRFLPLFQDELERIHLARRVRGDLVAPGPLAAITRRVSDVVPLISSAVRRATRIAIAMDARGFAAARDRTYLRTTAVTCADVAMAIVALAIALALLAGGALGGWLRLWDGRFVA